MPASTEIFDDDEEEERRLRKERRRREREKEKLKENLSGIEPTEEADDNNNNNSREEAERRRRREKRREERERNGTENGDTGDERRRRKEREEFVKSGDGDEERKGGRRRRSEREATAKATGEGGGGGGGDDDDAVAVDEERRKNREKRRQRAEDVVEAGGQTGGEGRKDDVSNGRNEDVEERRRRREERRRRREREEMEKSDRTKDEEEEELRFSRQYEELNQNENNQRKIDPSLRIPDESASRRSPSAKEEKEESRRKKEEEAKKRKEEKRRAKEKRKEERSPVRPTTSSRPAGDALSAVSAASAASDRRATSPLVDVLKTNRPPLPPGKSSTRVTRSTRDPKAAAAAAAAAGDRSNAFWAPLPLGSPASSLSLVLDGRESWQFWLPAKRHSSMNTEYSIPEDIVVEGDSKENNFKALNVAAEVDYASDFEKSDEEMPAAPPPTLAQPTLQQAPTKTDYDMADIFRAMNEENQQLVGVGPEVTYDASFASLAERAPAAAEVPEATPAAPEWDYAKGGVNFGDAVNRTIASMAMGRAAQRGKELKKLLTLESTTFDVFEMPPAEEHQMYIRNISTHVAQKCVQTGEDNLDEEVQTEDVDVEDRWTQHPPEGPFVCGRSADAARQTNAASTSTTTAAAANLFIRQIGRAAEAEDGAAPSAVAATSTPAYDVLTLGKFLDAAGSVLLQLMEEEAQIRGVGVVAGTLVSQGQFDVQTTPLMAGGRCGVAMAFPAVRPTVVALSFGAPVKSKTSPLRHSGAVCVWNLASYDKPLHTLATAPSLSTQNDTVVTSLCWSPSSCNVLIGGTKDGVLLLWDLREPADLHKSHEYKGDTFLVRVPTYSSAGTSADNNHETGVVSLATISHRSTSTTASDSSFQLVSMENRGKIFLWTALEVSPDPSGSEELLGLRPHGRLKLTKSSEINPTELSLEFPIANVDLFLSPATTKKFPGSPGLSVGESFAHVGGPKATTLAIDNFDPGKFLIATDAGVILHGHRQVGVTPHPAAYTIASAEISLASSVVTSLSLHPFGLDYLLAGTRDSTVFLFHREFQHPVISWTPPSSSKTGGPCAIIDVHWSPAKPSQFYVFQSPSTIFTFDLLSDIAKPSSVVNTAGTTASDADLADEYRIVAATVSQPFLAIEDKYSAFMGVSLKMGIMRIFKLTTMERKKREDETEKLRILLEKII